MKRGVITLDKAEIKEIIDKFQGGALSGTALESKLLSTLDNVDQNSSQIEVSEEELEIILDEFAIPTSEDSDAVRSLRNKLQKQLVQFRSVDQATI